MQHIDALISLDSEVSFILHKKLDQLYIAMKARKVQRVEALLRQRGRIDPCGNALAHFLLDIVDNIGVKLLRRGLIVPFHLDCFQVHSEPLLVVSDQELTDAEGVVVGSPM